MYAIEMNDVDHRQLAQVLVACQGKVVLSGYPSPLYQELFRSWRSVGFDVPSHAASGVTKSRRHETLWINFTAEEVAATGTC